MRRKTVPRSHLSYDAERSRFAAPHATRSELKASVNKAVFAANAFVHDHARRILGKLPRDNFSDHCLPP